MAHVQRWRFGPFEVDVDEHRLLRDGEPVALTRKAFALLAELLRRPGRLVTKAELFDSVWAGTVVTDGALSRVIRELRVALGDDATTPRYIATAHGLGFRFVAVVAGDGAAIESATSGAYPAPSRFLVGRDRDLARLDQALADTRSGQRRIVFVTGEAGIGKTTLVEAFLRRQANADTWTAQGRCVEQYGTGEAYLPVLEALEHLARAVGVDAFREVLVRYAPAWLALLPWLAHDVDRELLIRAAVDSSAQRLLREIAQALEVLAAQKPIVLWLEDLHWSDPSSLAVIAFLAGRPDPARLLLIASFRPAEAQAGAALLHGLALQLAQRGQAVPMPLGLLDAGAVGQYLRSRFTVAKPHELDSLGAFLHRCSDGNPLFTVALVDDLVRRGRLVEQDGTWGLRGSVADFGDGLPDDLRHLVHDQLERLAEDDRRLVEAAAACGTDFAAASLAAALQAETAAVEDQCMKLAQQGRFLRARDLVSWPDGTVSAGFGFLHALYWQGTYERVPQGRRTDWQRRIGLAQEQAHGAQCAPIAAELAMRFEAARDVERAFKYLLMAGTGALARCAYQECIDHLRRALAHVPELPAEQQPRHELEALLLLGSALMTVQGYASGEVEATYQRALELCRLCGRPGDLDRAQRGLWNVRFSRADLQGARATAEELLSRATARGDAGLVFDALAKLGHTCLHSGDFAGARVHLERALSLPKIAPTSVYRRESPRLLAYLSWVLWYMGLPDQALACSERSLAAAGADVSVHTRALVLGHACWVRWLRGEATEATAIGERQRTLSVEHGLAYWRVWGEFMLALTTARQGRVDAGVKLMSEASDAMRELGTVVGTTSWMYLRAEIELAAGRPGPARDAIAGSSDRLECGSCARNAAETARVEGLLALADDPGPPGRARAEDCFAAAIRIAQSQQALALELRAATSLARVWAADGQAARAADLLGPLYDRFAEGLGTGDLVEARALLDTLRPRASSRARTAPRC